MDTEDTPTVFTPGNEPYLGNHRLFVFDTLITSVMNFYFPEETAT